jgi:hypothetical protein
MQFCSSFIIGDVVNNYQKIFISHLILPFISRPLECMPGTCGEMIMEKNGKMIEKNFGVRRKIPPHSPVTYVTCYNLLAGYAYVYLPQVHFWG